MSKRIKLTKGRYVGENEACFITVDVGANHNRDLKTAKELIDKAAKAGADAIKFQIYSVETLYSKHVPRHSYYKKHLWDLIKEIETPREWIPKLKNYCDKKHIIFFATPFDIEAVDQLAPYVDFYKIASFELVDLQLIEYTAKKKKPLIISTGLANMEEIEDAYLTCKNAENNRIIFLQCASLYPAKPEIMNLKAMHIIKTAFPDTVVGLSDHTLGIHISVSAVAMGAKVIEKHLTLSRKMEGPDHSFAIEPDELKEMVRQIREIESALGDGGKLGPKPEEMENYQIARSSIHAKIKILKGTRITKEMFIIKRPAYGIKPKFIDVVVDRKAKMDIKKDEWITWEKIIELRKVEINDCDVIFKWRNYPDVRKHSFNTKSISWLEHKNWFYSKIKAPDTKIYIALLGKAKIGVIRFEIEKTYVKVSINLNLEFLGKGLGSDIIKLGTRKFLQETKVKKAIIAEIKKGNIASQKAFAKAGFNLVRENEIIIMRFLPV